MAVIDMLNGNKDSSYHGWSEQVKANYNGTLFMYVLFTSWEESELQYGKKVQKYLCNNARIPANHVLEFWNKRGQEVTRQAMNCKRVTITNAIKKQMRGK